MKADHLRPLKGTWTVKARTTFGNLDWVVKKTDDPQEAVEALEDVLD